MRNKVSIDEGSRNSRRGFLKSGAGVVVGVAATRLLQDQAAAQQNGANAGLLERLQNPNGRAILLKDGIVLSLDRQVGDFARADVLIQGKKITAVGPNVTAPAQSVVVNAAGMIIMPGFIDTHHHQYETILRGVIADGLFGTGDDPLPKKHYGSVIQQVFTPHYLPEDARISQLIASLSQISDGV